MIEPPKVDYIILCDAVAQDPQGKKTLYGLFDRIWSKKIPFNHRQFYIALRLIEGRGKHKIGLQIIDNEKEIVFKAPDEVPVEFSGPLGVVEFIAEFQDFQFKKDGYYEIRVTYDGQILEGYAKKFLIEKIE